MVECLLCKQNVAGSNPTTSTNQTISSIRSVAKARSERDALLAFSDKHAYRRDRRKDELLQSEGYFVLRFLAEDVMSDLGNVIARIIRHL